jgi:hypothetical protein
VADYGRASRLPSRLEYDEKSPENCPMGLRWPTGEPSRSGPGAVAHEADGVELGLLAGILLGALAHLVALVKQLDLFHLLEGLTERSLGVLELDLELIG